MTDESTDSICRNRFNRVFALIGLALFTASGVYLWRLVSNFVPVDPFDKVSQFFGYVAAIVLLVPSLLLWFVLILSVLIRVGEWEPKLPPVRWDDDRKKLQ
jgi:hypothetical protein